MKKGAGRKGTGGDVQGRVPGAGAPQHEPDRGVPVRQSRMMFPRNPDLRCCTCLIRCFAGVVSAALLQFADKWECTTTEDRGGCAAVIGKAGSNSFCIEAVWRRSRVHYLVTRIGLSRPWVPWVP